MRVSHVGLSTELRNIHPGYLDYIPNRPRRQPKEQLFTFPELPRKPPFDTLRSNILEMRVNRLKILQRICTGALILIGLSLLGQVVYEFLNEAPRLPHMRITAPKVTHSGQRLKINKIEKKFEAIASVLEYLINQQRSTASASNSYRSLPYMPELRSPIEQPRELQVVEVNVNKANLRVGPGLEHSPIMTVAKNTRLAVEIEQNGWYRIISPNGVRAWVSGKVIYKSNSPISDDPINMGQNFKKLRNLTGTGPKSDVE